ncbi:hypothetical protein [Haloarchaeobius sp. DYHT-AS-18]|uniref:hypothetical protein n=1 Tax=Haloarchaeobius sp. DYHT-AS-18 TaxID=3446117 RepID=UPI003EBE62B7
MRARVGQVIRRLALVTFVFFVVSLPVLYGIGVVLTPTQQGTDYYPPPMTIESFEDDIRTLHLDKYSLTERFMYRFDLGIDALLSPLWLAVGGVGLLFAFIILARKPTVPWPSSVPRTQYVSSDFRRRVTAPLSKLPDGVEPVLRGYGTVLSTGWLLLLTVLTLAVLVGPAPAGADAPEISPDDPPAELAADAIGNIGARPHVVTFHLHTSNVSRFEDDTQTVGYRLTVEPETEMRLLEMWPQYPYNNTVDDPHIDFLATRYAYWGEWKDGSWRRADDRPVGRLGWSLSDRFDDLENAARTADASVISQTASSKTIEYTDRSVNWVFGVSAQDNYSVRTLVTVATDDESHLERVVAERTNGSAMTRFEYRFTKVDTATVETPDHVPATAERLVWRAEHGLDRMASWVGL